MARRHIAASLLLLALAVLAYLLGFVSIIHEAVLLIIIFPYLSFSIFFHYNTGRRRKKAIDIIRRKTSNY
ncbi:MAG: hypothetical protein J7K61_05410 [Thermoplasmata archaeon]|nr:hypothetical protein [Thermoplasmata archaeon]